jgi:hypothetical protein
MLRRSLVAFVSLQLAAFPASTFGQTPTPDLAKFVPGKWMGPTGKAGVELQSVRDGLVTGTWLDITGINYPIGPTWVQGKTASGRFEKGVLHLVLPTGNKLELALSPDGTTLSGTRQVVNSGSYQPTQTQVTFKRN